MVLSKNYMKCSTSENMQVSEKKLTNFLEHNENMTVNTLHIKILTRIVEDCFPKQTKDQKLYQRSELLMKERREMTIKTTRLYGNINRKMDRKMKKYRIERTKRKASRWL